MVNNCHAKRDTKTRSGVAGHFILGYFSVSTRLCPLDSPLPIICHCPAHIIIGRAIQWNMPSGVAGLLITVIQRNKSDENSTNYLYIYMTPYMVSCFNRHP